MGLSVHESRTWITLLSTVTKHIEVDTKYKLYCTAMSAFHIAVYGWDQVTTALGLEPLSRPPQRPSPALQITVYTHRQRLPGCHWTSSRRPRSRRRTTLAPLAPDTSTRQGAHNPLIRRKGWTTDLLCLSANPAKILPLSTSPPLLINMNPLMMAASHGD